MKLLLTMAGTLAFTLLSFWFLRLWGEGQVFQAYEHPFWAANQTQDRTESKEREIAVVVNSFAIADEAVAISDKIILYLDVRMSHDGKLFVHHKGLVEPLLTPEKLGASKYRGDKPYFYSLDELRVYFPDLLEVGTFLQRYPQQRFILNIQDNADSIHTAILKLLLDFKSEKRVLIQSEIDVVIKSLRVEQPTWLYGSSRPEITRILSLQSLGLESVPSIRADVWITPLKYKGREIFNEGLERELHRRFKKVFIGPLENLGEATEAQPYKIDGLIFSSISEFKEYRNQRLSQ